MKRILFILTGFVLFNVDAQAQEQNKNSQTKTISAYTKGYYAIGNNAAKLPKPIVITANGSTSIQTGDNKTSKGYYAISGKQMANVPATKVVIGSGQPVYNKGYYAAKPSEVENGKQ